MNNVRTNIEQIRRSIAVKKNHAIKNEKGH